MCESETLTNEQIIHEVICNRSLFSMSEIESILASILDPATIVHNEIIRFVVSLPCIQPVDLGPEPEDQNCAVCLNKYGRQDHLDKDTATKLPCGHIMGAECIKTWLKRRKTCPLCRRKVFSRPVVSGRLNDQKLEQVARDFLFYAKTYLLDLKTKIYGNKQVFMSSLVSQPWMDDSYPAFVAWARESGVVGGGWNSYWYGWTGRAVWKDYGQFCRVCSPVAYCFILRLDEDFKAYERKDCRTVLLRQCKRSGGVGNGD